VASRNCVPPEEAIFLYMDVCRFIAAFLVVLNHSRSQILVDYRGVPDPGALISLLYYMAGFGHQSVMIFFVLSGFWITKSVVVRTGQTHFWPGYLIDRLSRLGIVLVPVLVLGGTLDLIGLHSIAADFYSSQHSAGDIPYVTSTLSMQSLIASLVFLQSLVAPPFGSNAPLWSLAYEFWYFVWFPALWLAARKRVSWALSTLILGWFFPSLTMGFLSWLCGTGLYFACANAQRRGWLGKRAIAWPVLIVGIVLFTVCLAHSRFYPMFFAGDVLISASFAAALFGVYLAVPPQLRWLRPFATYGAQSSFSLYSIHFPILVFLAALLGPLHRLQPSAGSIALVAMEIGFVIIVGLLFSRITERNTATLRALIRARALPN